MIEKNDRLGSSIVLASMSVTASSPILGNISLAACCNLEQRKNTDTVAFKHVNVYCLLRIQDSDIISLGLFALRLMMLLRGDILPIYIIYKHVKLLNKEKLLK